MMTAGMRAWRLALAGWLMTLVPVPVLAAEAPAPSPPRAMNAVDFVELPRLAGPRQSPDGRHIVYIRSHTDWAKNKHRDDYLLADAATGDARLLSDWPRKDDSLSSVSWAPDSGSFAFTMEGKDDDHDQIYLYDIAAKSLTRLTAQDSRVTDIAWSADGASLYFRARAADPVPAALRKFRIKPYDVSAPYRLWRFDRKDGSTHAVAATEGQSVTDYALARDGSRILLTLQPDGAHYGSVDRELWLHDIATGTLQRLTHNRYAEKQARLAPDNRRFAYIATVNDKGEPYYEDNLFLQSVGDAAPQLLTADGAMEVLDFAWDRQADSLTLLANIGLRNMLFRLSVRPRSLTQLTDGDRTLTSWHYDPRSGSHVALVADAASPGEVMMMGAGETALRPVTHDHATLSQRFLLPRQTAFRWTGRDDQPLEGLLVYPVNHRPGTPFPLITITHGGPRSSSQIGSWNMSRAVPVFAGQGYGVFLPNHRGGTGYGDAFLRDMVGRYFNHAHLDLLDGVDALVAQGLADPDRLIAMGWSAGGHMTNKLITITDRFKAASSGAGAADWISLYGESDVRDNRTPWFGGTPWEKDAPLENYAEQSILKDAWRVKTPTLFFSGGEDERVPPTQAILIYRGVRDAGAPTHLYVGEGEPHNFRKPGNQLFKINAELDWYARHVTGTAYQPVLPPTPQDASPPAEG